MLSLGTKAEMVLPEDCKALFSTESGLVKKTLADIIQHVHTPFPSGAMIHLNADIYQDPSTSKMVNTATLLLPVLCCVCYTVLHYVTLC